MRTAGGGHAQQDRPEQEAVAVSRQPVPLRTGPLLVVEQRQVRRAEALNPADVAGRARAPRTARPGISLVVD